MRKITFSVATQEAMKEEMQRDKNVFLMGEDIARQGGIFGQQLIHGSQVIHHLIAHGLFQGRNIRFRKRLSSAAASVQLWPVCVLSSICILLTLSAYRWMKSSIRWQRPVTCLADRPRYLLYCVLLMA